MNNKVQNALQAALNSFNQVSGYPVKEIEQKLVQVFESDKAFMEKVDAMDEALDSVPRVEKLREVFFDLLLINFFTEDVKKLEEDYLESPEWEEIEEDTLDRGTELLNLLLYLKECEDEEIEPDIEDYLKEFLLVDEDEFQDEHRIYEPVIANQILVESSYEEISKVAKKLGESTEIKELFYPIMSFFHEKSPSASVVEKYVAESPEPEFDGPVYAILISFNQA